jgi:DNA-binding CsgD family transcriptional regulator
MRRVWAEGIAPAPNSPAQSTVDEAPLIPSNAGFLLLDSALKPIYANKDSVNILCYPEIPVGEKALMQAFHQRIEALMNDRRPSEGNPLQVEFPSGRRTYLMRAFYLDSPLKNPLQPTYAVLLERQHHVLLELANVSKQYNLTNREVETLRLLIEGLTSKEIASHLKISPNTVKVFLRQIMLKMGVTTRAGIIGKFVSG